MPTKHTEKTVESLKLVPDGGKYTDLPGDMAKNYKYHESLHRYCSYRPSLTIDTGHRTHFHYKWNRIPTVRENARLQSFPDDFISASVLLRPGNGQRGSLPGILCRSSCGKTP